MGYARDSHQCGSDAIDCRRNHIAVILGLSERKTQARGVIYGHFEGTCPSCRHGGFSIKYPDKPGVTHRHIWACNCKHCLCDASKIRAAMQRRGAANGCLGTYARNHDVPARKNTTNDPVGGVLDWVLANPDLKPADVRIHIATTRWGPAPAEGAAFVKFAMRAGVGRRQAYEAAHRWGRFATEVVPELEKKSQAATGQPGVSRAETARPACGNRTD